jgi:hypothetical protein
MVCGSVLSCGAYESKNDERKGDPVSEVEKSLGLFQKYKVKRTDGKPISDGCIVLEWKSKSSRAGIRAFSEAVRKDGYEKLADELDDRLEMFEGSYSHWDEAVKFIKEIPMTWIPALLIELVKTGYAKKTFLPGKATQFLRDNIQGEI